jgi:hypothetical protein
MSLVLGRLLVLSWTRQTEAIRPWLASLHRTLAALMRLPLPETVQISVPEGYAYYGLYPETYFAAATRCWNELRPQRAVCIGIRSIGTSLSAVVAATLAACGVPIHAFTVRPRGHPFDRRLHLTVRLAALWRALREAYFLIVDEGPGLSGSSFACVAQKLAELGVSDERIVFLPSWEPEASQLLSTTAQQRWRRHRKYTADFAAVWLHSGRLRPAWPQSVCHDLSGGRWRALVYQSDAEYPAVQPQHERRKYLYQKRGGRAAVLLKFAGLGRYGTAKLRRAAALAAAGFAPRVFGLRHGFLITEFVAGRPLTPGDVEPSLLHTMARYLAYLQQHCPAPAGASSAALLDMIRVNVTEGLGADWAQRLQGLEPLQAAGGAMASSAVDGRMLPHEWLRTAHGFIKTDGVDHHADHFFPGCQDIAWDLAGSCAEFRLDRAQRALLVQQYQALSRDTTVTKRLPFFLIAYLAYRLGYTTLAATALGPSPDGARFTRLTQRYAALLRRAICAHLM